VPVCRLICFSETLVLILRLYSSINQKITILIFIIVKTLNPVKEYAAYVHSNYNIVVSVYVSVTQSECDGVIPRVAKYLKILCLFMYRALFSLRIV
jgi:hypothetical protein